MNTPRLLVIADPIDTLRPATDMSLALSESAQKKGFAVDITTPDQLFLKDGFFYAHARPLTLNFTKNPYYTLGLEHTRTATDYQFILLRKDPPFDLEYYYLTQLCEHAERAGVRVINRPQSVRRFNEKLIPLYFPNHSAPTLVTKCMRSIHAFLDEQQQIVLKPLNRMAGQSVFTLSENDPNRQALIETLTDWGNTTLIVQRFLKEVYEGDKRILLINGIPVPHVLKRTPQGYAFRANTGAGGKSEAVPLSQDDIALCEQLRPFLLEHGLWIAGIDVIGRYLTEVNITSPTCIRLLEHHVGENLTDAVFESLV